MKKLGRRKQIEVNDFLRTLEPKYHPHDFDQFINGELQDNKWLGIQSGGSARIRNINLEGKSNLLLNYTTWHNGGSFEIRIDRLDGEVIANGKVEKANKTVLVSYKISHRKA